MKCFTFIVYSAVLHNNLELHNTVRLQSYHYICLRLFSVLATSLPPENFRRVAFRRVFRLVFSTSCFRRVVFDELFSTSFPRFIQLYLNSTVYCMLSNTRHRNWQVHEFVCELAMNCLIHVTFPPPPRVLGEPVVVGHVLLQTRVWTFPTLFAVFILFDLRSSNSNLTLFLIFSFTYFHLSLPVIPSLFSSSVASISVSRLLIGVPDGSGCDVVGAIAVLHPIGDVIVGVCACSVSICRPISALIPVALELLSVSELSLSTFGTIESESRLDEPYMTTRLYVGFFEGIVGIVWLGRASSSA